MPSEDMDQRRLSSMHVPLSFSSEESILCTENKDGFWRNELVPDQHGKEGMPITSASKYAVSTHQDTFFKEKNAKLGLENLMGSERTANSSMMPWNAINHDLTQSYDLFGKGNKADLNGVLHENGLFSSSLPNIFNRKLTFSATSAFPDREHDTIKSSLDDESFKSLEEIEAQTIGNLLPDDDELLSGVNDGKEYAAQLNNNDEMEDDIFCSLGGMELEINDDTDYNRSSNVLNSKVENGLQNNLNNEGSAKHPSRILFVGNIDSNIDDADLKVLFEKYGDVHSIHMASKHQGYIMISYYDIRSASNAMRALQNKSIMNKKLDIHYSSPKEYLTENDADQATVVVFNIDSSVSNEAFHQIFGVYGGVKEIRQTHKHQHRYIEFYDIRDAQAAVQAIKRSNTFGMQVKLESSCSWDTKECSIQQSPLELGKETLKDSHQQDNTHYNLSSHCYGKFPIKAVTSNGLKNGVIGPFIDTSLPGISSSIPYLSSPVRDAFVGSSNNNQAKNGELSNSMGQTKFGLQCMPNLHHALPEYHNNLANGVLYNSPNTLSAMAFNIARHTELVDEKQLHRMNPAGLSNQPFEHIEGGNSSCTLHGHQYAPNSSNAYLRPSGHVMWPSSPSFVNNVPMHSQLQLHGIPRAPSQMLNTVLPLHHHLVGSAPTMNPSLWDRVNAYSGDSIDASVFQPGSLGSMGYSGNSILHPREVPSQNIFGRCNYMEPSLSSAHGRLASPQQRSHMFHGRNPMVGTPPTFDAPIDRNRSRRNDSSSNQTDNKKQFELDIDRIARGDDSRTTLMIKNIPNKYTSKMLLATIDEHHRGTYDFIYLPIDFKNKCNVGYAFINMTDPQQIVPFYKAFNGKKWEKFNSEKVASLAYARIQGKAALIAHFQNSSLMNEDKRCRPILFHTDGPNAGDQEPFPMGVNIRSRSGRPKIHINEDSRISSSLNSCITGEISKDVNFSSGSVK